MARGTQENSGQRGRDCAVLTPPSWPANHILFIADFIWVISQLVSEEITSASIWYFHYLKTPPFEAVANVAPFTQRYLLTHRLVQLIPDLFGSGHLPTQSTPAAEAGQQESHFSFFGYTLSSNTDSFLFKLKKKRLVFPEKKKKAFAANK